MNSALTARSRKEINLNAATNNLFSSVVEINLLKVVWY